MRLTLILTLFLFSCTQDNEISRPNYCSDISSWYITFSVHQDRVVYHLNQAQGFDPALVSFVWTLTYPDGRISTWDTELPYKALPICPCCEVSVDILCTNYNAVSNRASGVKIGTITLNQINCQ